MLEAVTHLLRIGTQRINDRAKVEFWQLLKHGKYVTLAIIKLDLTDVIGRLPVLPVNIILWVCDKSGYPAI